MTGGRGTALVVVDVQNDFCTGPVATSRYPGDPAALETAVRNTARAVEAARARATDVVFVRFVGDPAHQGAAWRRRDAERGKPPKCLEGSWGAEFAEPLVPAPGERVFTKRACFDAFLSDGFEEHLGRRGTGHLAFAGLFADVCVDSTARTAFQKGFHVTVLSDCTVALHTPDEQALGFMRRVYGARVATHDRAALWTRHPDEGEEGEEEEEGTGT
ncbi:MULTISPECIES: cysteine hydrolase [unclassified Streptomyces]|uniref:cysteine hydrolase family protein n=1 Tax=unclassified Streptomyces TaxID=2593676 RepID=UPI0001C1BAC5|nr:MULTISPECIES: cysteine hydrolase [unclassified Streptomyces]MYR67561.1 isochorismatase family protein [Streptomyces sp. SID4939]MYR99090.1 isochorismatase family protein [Streptomyces sp. SID4940]MYT63416.1 isochorismatase family protein [Streptomyces sp. SID8357]MYT85666.1 isochorismatase family protein [Streptomyces sp. SID8360]MYW38783.1 isochorismatase family protein [Streptomyces sp. SID1]